MFADFFLGETYLERKKAFFCLKFSLFFLVRLIFNEKRLFFVCWPFSWWDLLIFNEKRLFLFEVDFFSWRDTRSSNGNVSPNKKHVYNTSPDVFTFCPQETGNSNFWDEEFFGMSSYMCKNCQDDIPTCLNFIIWG